MELTKAIRDRRSIREYLPDSVNNEEIKSIIAAGILAPSAKNKQPWEFVVVTDKELKKKISDALYETDERKSPSLIRTTEIMASAPVIILVYSKILDDELDWYSMSIGACIENMLLEATNLGLGSLWVGYVNRARKEINAILNINDKVLMSAVLVGYKNEFPASRPRNDIDSVIDWR